MTRIIAARRGRAVRAARSPRRRAPSRRAAHARPGRLGRRGAEPRRDPRAAAHAGGLGPRRAVARRAAALAHRPGHDDRPHLQPVRARHQPAARSRQPRPTRRCRDPVYDSEARLQAVAAAASTSPRGASCAPRSSACWARAPTSACRRRPRRRAPRSPTCAPRAPTPWRARARRTSSWRSALLTLAEAQLSAGTSPAIDVTRARTQVATSQGALLIARNQRDRSRIDLARALGMDPASRTGAGRYAGRRPRRQRRPARGSRGRGLRARTPRRAARRAGAPGEGPRRPLRAPSANACRAWTSRPTGAAAASTTATRSAPTRTRSR